MLKNNPQYYWGLMGINGDYWGLMEDPRYPLIPINPQ